MEKTVNFSKVDLGDIHMYKHFGPLVACSVGLMVNIYVAHLMLKKNLAKDQYKYVILNLTIADLLFCIVTIVNSVASIINELRISKNLNQPISKFETIFCKIFGNSPIALLAAMVYALPCIALNRFISLYYPKHYKKVFTKVNVLIWSLLCFAVAALINFGIIFVGSPEERRITTQQGLNCAMHPSNSRLTRVLFLCLFLTIVLSLALACYLNYRVYQKIKERSAALMLVGEEEDLKENVQLLKMAALQNIGPVVCLAPFMIFSGAKLVFLIAKNEKMTEELGSGWYEMITKSFLYTNPAWDGLCTVLLIKALRQATGILVKKCGRAITRMTWIGKSNRSTVVTPFSGNESTL